MPSQFDNQGLALGEVYGFRWWQIIDHPRGRLRGMFGPWSPGENRAACNYQSRHPDVAAPVEDCGCGMWAYWTPEAAPIPSGRRVAGVVKGYGDTLIGDRGCRCQLATVVALSFEKVAQDALVTEQLVRAAGPPPGVHWHHPEGAMRTYLAFGGTPVDVPVVRSVTDYQDNLARQAEQEFQLGQEYGVPVYTTIAAMLALHPPTKDYLPQSEIPGLLESDWRALKATLDQGAAALSDAIQNALVPHTISGTDAIKRLNARLKDQP